MSGNHINFKFAHPRLPLIGDFDRYARKGCAYGDDQISSTIDGLPVATVAEGVFRDVRNAT